MVLALVDLDRVLAAVLALGQQPVEVRDEGLLAVAGRRVAAQEPADPDLRDDLPPPALVGEGGEVLAGFLAPRGGQHGDLGAVVWGRGVPAVRPTVGVR